MAPAIRTTAYFNPRSPCGERPIAAFLLMYYSQISIHAPRAGSDAFIVDYRAFSRLFQSTLPVRGATRANPRSTPDCGFQSTLPVRGATCVIRGRVRRLIISIHAPRAGSDRAMDDTGVLNPISIHAPRAGSDPRFEKAGLESLYFNPRSPCGERLRAPGDA